MSGLNRDQMPRIFIVTAAVHLVLAVIYSSLMMVDATQLLGINAWIKPLKFAVTGLIYLITLAIFSRNLPDSLTQKKGNRHAYIISAMILGETLLIGMQSARGVISHFNQKTIFDGIIFAVMGVMIVVSTVSFTLMMRHFFKGAQKIGGAYLSGIRWAVVLFLVGSVVGGVMSGMNRHTVGAADGGPGLSLVNFSTVAGDLRIAHFVGLHALQVLPFLGWLLTRSEANSSLKNNAFMAFSCLYALGLTALFVQAMLGRPLIAFS